MTVEGGRGDKRGQLDCCPLCREDVGKVLYREYMKLHFKCCLDSLTLNFAATSLSSRCSFIGTIPCAASDVGKDSKAQPDLAEGILAYPGSVSISRSGWRQAIS